MLTNFEEAGERFNRFRFFPMCNAGFNLKRLRGIKPCAGDRCCNRNHNTSELGYHNLHESALSCCRKGRSRTSSYRGRLLK